MVGIKCVWDDSEKTVIRMYVSDYWDWDDLNSAIEDMTYMIREVQHQVDVLTIMRPTAKMPSGNITHYLKDAIVRLPRNVGTHIMVGGNILCNRALRALSHRYTCMTGRLLQTNSLGEAYRMIARNRPERYEEDELVA